jgi:hypothetical protein
MVAICKHNRIAWCNLTKSTEIPTRMNEIWLPEQTHGSQIPLILETDEM